MDKKITGADVREWRKKNDWTLSALGGALGGLTTSQVSKLESGHRPISPAEQTLLQILIWNKLPESFPAWEAMGTDRLEFTALEWELITNIARREGLTPQEWIAAKIRKYLEFYDAPVSAAENLRLAASPAGDAGLNATGTDALGK